MERRRTDTLYHALITLFLFAIMVLTLLGSGWLIAGEDGLMLAGLAPLAGAIFAPRMSAQAVMRLKRAIPVDPWQSADLHGLLSRLSRAAGLARTPNLYWDRSGAINAYAVGMGDDAAIAISDGALRQLTPREMAGVLAHEVSHIAAGDSRLSLYGELIRLGTVAVSALGLAVCVLLFAIGVGEQIPFWIPVAFFAAPHICGVLQSALSRRREFAADQAGVRLTGDPLGLASALGKIKILEGGFWARLMGYSLPSWHASFFRTHPVIEERIERLVALAEPAPTPVYAPPRNSHARVPYRSNYVIRIF